MPRGKPIIDIVKTYPLSVPDGRVATAIGVSREAVQRNRFKLFGKRSSGNPGVGRAIALEIFSIHKDGLNSLRIAEEVGAHYNTVNRILHSRGLRPHGRRTRPETLEERILKAKDAKAHGESVFDI